jgi:hypothetical protein
MTAQPLSSALAKVRALLPMRVQGSSPFIIADRHGKTFCFVPNNGDDAIARAELIRDAMNEME